MGNTALITGGSSGIGRAFAERFAADGHNIILVARNKERLEATASDLQRKYGSNVQTISADLSHKDQIERVGNYLTDTSSLSILVNSAGFGVPGRFSDIDSEANQEMINTHIVAPTYLCHAAVPKMRENGGGAIINVSSLAGFLTGRGIYNTTKSYLTNFSRTLQRNVAEDGIKVQALCPGYTHTGFHSTKRYQEEDFAKNRLWLWMSAEDVVDVSLKSLKSKKVVCIPGFKNKLIYLLSPLLRKG